MKLSRDEDLFLRHWMHDEVHFQEGRGPAKQLQLLHRAVPADLAILIAAAFPDPLEQHEAGFSPAPQEAPDWPWTQESFLARLNKARETLTQREQQPSSNLSTVR